MYGAKLPHNEINCGIKGFPASGVDINVLIAVAALVD
jgi:hypothetical protein